MSKGPWMRMNLLLVNWCLFLSLFYPQGHDLDMVVLPPFAIPQRPWAHATDRGKKNESDK